MPPDCFLFDNGSLRAESTLSLRKIAEDLEKRLGRGVKPVSLLHSSAVSIEELKGQKAELLEPALEAAVNNGQRDFVLVPLFFGPSAALTDYLPERLASLRKKFPGFKAKRAACLVDIARPDDLRLASMIADHVRKIMADKALSRPSVVLVDHGSPQRAVTAVRDFLGIQVRQILSQDVDHLVVSSMERRPEPEYDFNEPLLAHVLEQERGDVVVALQFISPGRHAGADGDVEEICRAAESACPDVRTYMTELVGVHPGLIEILAERYESAVGTAG